MARFALAAAAVVQAVLVVEAVLVGRGEHHIIITPIAVTNTVIMLPFGS